MLFRRKPRKVWFRSIPVGRTKHGVNRWRGSEARTELLKTEYDLSQATDHEVVVRPRPLEEYKWYMLIGILVSFAVLGGIGALIVWAILAYVAPRLSEGHFWTLVVGLTPIFTVSLCLFGWYTDTDEGDIIQNEIERVWGKETKVQIFRYMFEWECFVNRLKPLDSTSCPFCHADVSPTAKEIRSRVYRCPHCGNYVDLRESDTSLL